MKKIIIGVTDCSKYDNYAKWIAQEPDVEAVKLGYKQDTFGDIKRCHGILLSGGEDVHPKFYNRPEYLSYCYLDDVDEKRDEFELEVIRYTQEKKLPLFGICRGLQIANVFFGGSLIPDIPTFKNSNHSKIEGEDRYHEIKTEASSQLRKLTGLEQGEVNSAHHQSVDRLGDGLVASAFSPEGIVEGIERQSPDGKPLLLLVQWHPERMINQDSAFTKKIRQSFLDPIRAMND
jgi:putative glutamine amidotransferase